MQSERYEINTSEDERASCKRGTAREETAQEEDRARGRARRRPCSRETALERPHARDAMRDHKTIRREGGTVRWRTHRRETTLENCIRMAKICTRVAQHTGRVAHLSETMLPCYLIPGVHTRSGPSETSQEEAARRERERANRATLVRKFSPKASGRQKNEPRRACQSQMMR